MNLNIQNLRFNCSHRPTWCLQVETSSGVVIPATFDMDSRCPDEVVRRIRVSVSSYDPTWQGRLLETYDTQCDVFQIAPACWYLKSSHPLHYIYLYIYIMKSPMSLFACFKLFVLKLPSSWTLSYCFNSNTNSCFSSSLIFQKSNGYSTIWKGKAKPAISDIGQF